MTIDELSSIQSEVREIIGKAVLISCLTNNDISFTQIVTEIEGIKQNANSRKEKWVADEALNLMLSIRSFF